jgi:hypothetical protein
MAVQKPKWTKSTGKFGTQLPPLTTDEGKVGVTNWHRIKMAEGVEQATQWLITWDTTRREGSFNTAQDATRGAALDRARKFLQMGFVVYSIVDPRGNDTMTEEAINAQLMPAAR